MSVVDDYLETLSEPERATLARLYDVVRRLVPDVTEGMSYGVPAFKYKGKSLVAIMANKNFLSLYPFCSLERLGLDFSAFDCTKGSIHFTSDKSLSDDLLRSIIRVRMQSIDEGTS